MLSDREIEYYKDNAIKWLIMTFSILYFYIINYNLRLPFNKTHYMEESEVEAVKTNTQESWATRNSSM
jgi:hypothetical protein